MSTTKPRPCRCETTQEDDVRWLALLLRRAMLVVVRGVEKRYDASGKDDERAA